MKWLNDSKITLLLAVLVLWPAQSPAKEYVLTVGNEQLRFVPQAEKGYVVKQASRPAGISALAGTLFLEEGKVQPIGGLDRHGLWIVENDGPASRNDAVMAELIQNGAAEYAAPLFSSNGETVAVIPEIVLRVHSGVDARQVHFLCESMALAIIKPMEFTTQEYLLDVLGPDAEAVFTALENLNDVEWIEWAAPNTASQPKLRGQALANGSDSGEQLRISSSGQDANSLGVFPNDEYFPRQWHLHNTGQSGGTPNADINAPEAWEITTGDPNIVIAEMDTGVQADHPDLLDNLVPGYDFIDDDDQPDPSLDPWPNGHGTSCSGIIAAQGNNRIGVTGVTWNCKIMPVRIGGYRADQTAYFISQATEATAYRWAAAHGADVIVSPWWYGQTANDILHSGIVDVTKAGGLGRDGKGCVFVAAAGNDSSLMKWYPSKYPEVMAVGIADHNDNRGLLSDYGPELDIVAPSGWQSSVEEFLSSKGRGALWSTDFTGTAGFNNFDPNLDYTNVAGTCGASSVAAGVAALVLSVDPNLTNTQVQYILERSAKDLGVPGRDDYYGWGRVDARAAIDVIMSDLTDLNNDDQTDFKDLSYLAQYWKQNTSSADLAPIGHRDGKVDVNDLSILAKYWLKHIDIPPLQASNPNPAHITLNVDINADLSWTAGYLASSYDVYFGKTNPPPFVRNQKETTFDPGTMAYSTGYRWRIDSVNSAGTTTGVNWSFKTAGPPP